MKYLINAFYSFFILKYLVDANMKFGQVGPKKLEYLRSDMGGIPQSTLLMSGRSVTENLSTSFPNTTKLFKRKCLKQIFVKV